MGEWLGSLTPGEVIGFVVSALAALGAIGYWVGCVNTDRGAFKKTLDGFMNEIRTDIKNIFDRLPGTPALARAGSPSRLTEFGESIAKSMKAREWASDISTKLLPDIEKMTDFEVDEYCNRFVRDNLDDDWKKKTAATAYNHGLEKEDIAIVLRIALRDALLERRSQSE